MFGLEDGWPTGKLIPRAHEWGQSALERLGLVCGDSLEPRELPGGTQGHCKLVSEPTLVGTVLSLELPGVTPGHYMCGSVVCTWGHVHWTHVGVCQEGTIWLGHVTGDDKDVRSSEEGCVWHTGLSLNRIHRLPIPIRRIFFSDSPSKRNLKFKRAWLGGWVIDRKVDPGNAWVRTKTSIGVGGQCWA